MTSTVVVLGGYGNFGSRIVSALANEPGTRVLIAGRDAYKAKLLADSIRGNVEALSIDQNDPAFADRLRDCNASVLVHTAGPFQGQNYAVAAACIDAGCHYVDIADARQYVCGLSALDAEARKRNLLIVAGASSLPALSAAVIDEFAPQFSQLDSIEHGISASGKPPGIASMAAVLSYVGKGFHRWQSGTWRTVYGWQNLVLRRFPNEVGRRWLANCDVADLELFVQRYRGVQSVIFKAGVGLTFTNVVLWLLSWLVRWRAVRDLALHTKLLNKLALMIEPLGTRWSAMHVEVNGMDHRSRPLRRTWQLLAGDNDGPNIPCMPAIALVRKLLRHEITTRGAMPCVGLLSTQEILTAIPNLNLRVVMAG